MLYSKLFGKTLKEAEKDMNLPSQKFLFQGGFIRESTAGRYYFLPLGQRVHDKIVKIIEEEMNRAGAQKMISPILQPLELWQETNRDSSGGYELMIVEDRRGAKFTLGGTGEEMFVDVVRKFQLSYKDLPINIYQFGNKFRDELRSRGGLLRVREFVMKDGYSFHISDEDFKKEYQNMWDTYLRIYNRVGLDIIVVAADNGYFGGDYCHEFIVESPIGESNFLVSEDGKYVAHEDIATFKRELINEEEELKEYKIIEQPTWIKTIKDNEEYYKLPASRFLKNVVYKNRNTGEIVIATIRGDLEVNSNKLEHVTNMVGLLDDATNEDLEKIGTKSGYVHAWGHHGCIYVGDLSLRSVKNFIGGQKKETIDSINVNYGRDFEHEVTADIAKAKEGFYTEDGGSKLLEKKGVEVGNIFQLGQYYSKKMHDAVFTNQDGSKQPFFMGCYGIGIGRTLATIVEKFNDEKGIIWPESIAPYTVHLIGLNLENEEVKNKVNAIYQVLLKINIEVIFDDRENVSTGEKFADADLIGIPWRVVVSKRTEGKVEVKKRNEKQSKVIDIEELISLIS